jgi:hypothetical protein
MSPGRAQRRGSDDDRGQSNVVGYLLVLAIIIGGTSLVVVLGADALEQTNSVSELKRAEQTMTLFDSRAAMVALGTSDTQSLNVKQQSGEFETDPDAGYISIKHVNYEEGATEEVYNQSLGAVVYENNDRRIAYQGGGVWRLDPRGEARMVSPPEFHYRGATLTLPIIQVQGQSSASGSPSVSVSSDGDARRVYPNTSADLGAGNNGTGAPYDYQGTDRHYRNPVKNGTVRVFVHSEYYQGWANYFDQRTSGEVRVYDSNQTVRLTLVSLAGSLGQFPIPNEGVAQPVEGVGAGHPIKEFDLSLATDQNFNGESSWSLYAVEDGKEMEIHVEMANGGGCRDARIAYYFNGPSEYQEWQTGWLDPSAGTDDAYECTSTGGDEELEFNLTSRNVQATYEDVTKSGNAGKWCFDVDQDSPDDPADIDQHPEDPGTTNIGDSQNLNFTTNHYLSRMGTNYDLKVQDSQGSSPPACDAYSNGNGGSNMVEEGASVGVLEYTEATGAEFITYLHITENEVDVDFD